MHYDDSGLKAPLIPPMYDSRGMFSALALYASKSLFFEFIDIVYERNRSLPLLDPQNY
jgi:hypothetical protein